MTRSSPPELAEFERGADAWFGENTPREVDFMLPLTFMEVGTDQQFDFLREWQNKVYEAGYLGAAWPAEYGGGGLDQSFQTVATNAMRKHRAPIMLNAIGLNWTGPLLLEMGAEAHKRRHIKRILSAEDIWCQGFSEPEHGSDLGSVQLKAVRDGDEYVLNGIKTWTTLGRYADYMIVLARTENQAPSKYAGLSFFLAPMKVTGIATTPIRKLTGEHGFTQTFFSDARIPADGLIGKEGGGWRVAMRTLEYERGSRHGQAGGYVITEVDLRRIVDLARRARRDGAPAIDDPVIRDRLVQFLIDIEGHHLNGARAGIPALNQDRPTALPLMSKLVQTELVRRLNHFALTIQGGGSAYYVGDANALDDGLWIRGYLNAFSATIGGGTSEIQRNIIGEHVLGLPKSPHG